jgi:hypothetical protein
MKNWFDQVTVQGPQERCSVETARLDNPHECTILGADSFEEATSQQNSQGPRALRKALRPISSHPSEVPLMQMSALGRQAFTILTLYDIWHVFPQSLLRRDYALRERVASMLCVTANPLT